MMSAERSSPDGFLAYWIVQLGPPEGYDKRFVQTAGYVVHTATSLIDPFHQRVLEDFRGEAPAAGDDQTP